MKQIKSEAYENNQDIPNNLHKYLSRCPQKTCHLKVSSAAGTLGRNKDKGENETARLAQKLQRQRLWHYNLSMKNNEYL